MLPPRIAKILPEVEMNMDLSDETKNQASLLPELWGMIFRKFDTDFIRKNLTLVCKEWHDFIRKDPMISGELKIKRDQSTENVNSLLASYPVLKDLSFMSHGKISNWKIWILSNVRIWKKWLSKM